MAAKGTKGPKNAGLPPLDPVKAANAKRLVDEGRQGINQGREGRWRLAQACLGLLDEGKTFQHYEHTVDGKTVRFREPNPFLAAVFNIKPPTLKRWLEPGKNFDHDPFIKIGPTILSEFLTYALLKAISPIPRDPSDVLIDVPAGKGKPPVPKRLADCREGEVRAAGKALKGAPPSKIPEPLQALYAEAMAAYRRKTGPEAPDLLKVRVSKDGTPQVSVPEWLAFTPEAGAFLIAAGQSVFETARRHPETITAHVAPAARPPPIPPGAATTTQTQAAAG